MYKKYITLRNIVVLGCLLSATLQAQEKWQWVNPLPQGNELNDVFFWDRYEGWAVGDVGTILHTKDGGRNWEFEESGTSADLLSVCFVDANTGWILGREGYRSVSLLHTINGGAAWDIIYSDENSWESRRTFFISQHEGWFIHGNRIKHTIDGGRSWVEQDWVYGGDLWDIIFVDNKNGWIVGGQVSEDYLGGIILRTTNGGGTWELQRLEEEKIWLKGLWFVDKNVGWVVGYDGAIFYTADGGMTWEPQESNVAWTLTQAFFVDTLHGWVAGQSGTLLHTDDGGRTWIKQLDYMYRINGLCFTDSQTGWFVGYAGAIYHTDNGGAVWHEQSEGSRKGYYKVQFVDNDNGWILAEGTFLHTSNGGQSWETIDDVPSIGEYNSSLFFLDALHGWIRSGTEIWYSENGGENWELIGSLPASYQGGPIYVRGAQSIFFTDLQNGWIVGGGTEITPDYQFIYTGIVLHTSDGGRNWGVQLEKENTAPLHEVFFIDKNHGWAAGAFYAMCDPIPCPPIGSVACTEDGGKTWITQNFEDFYYVGGIFFVDSQHGWISGYGILHTTDGGKTWTRQDTLGSSFSDIHFLDLQEGWTVGSHRHHGIIFHTTDGGQIWELYQDNMPGISDIDFTDHTGWIVGGTGLIMKYNLELPIRGDVNNDGSVDVLDVERAVNIILGLGNPPTHSEGWAADCNGDGFVNVLDIVGIINVILGTGTCRP